MKRLLFFTTLITAFILTSCISDDESVQYYGELGNLKGENANKFEIHTDANNILRPQGMLPSYFKFEDGKRVLVQYSVASVISENEKSGTYSVEVTSIRDLFEKELLTVDDVARDTLKKDPVNIRGAWMGKDYLNIDFSYRGTGQKEFPHYIDLAFDPNRQDKEKHIVLDLMHNSNSDNYFNLYPVLMSVSLKELQIEGQDSVLIWLRVNDQLYKPETIIYRY